MSLYVTQRTPWTALIALAVMTVLSAVANGASPGGNRSQLCYRVESYFQDSGSKAFYGACGQVLRSLNRSVAREGPSSCGSTGILERSFSDNPGLQQPQWHATRAADASLVRALSDDYFGPIAAAREWEFHGQALLKRFEAGEFVVEHTQLFEGLTRFDPLTVYRLRSRNVSTPIAPFEASPLLFSEQGRRERSTRLPDAYGSPNGVLLITGSGAVMVTHDRFREAFYVFGLIPIPVEGRINKAAACYIKPADPP